MDDAQHRFGLAGHLPRGLRGEPRPSHPPRFGLMALLVLIALLPRVAFAAFWNVLWADSVTYLAAAEALRAGDLQMAFGDLGLNLYPLIVAGFRVAGDNWTTVGEAWSVFWATLAILPLYGWVRRQFNDRVALVACLLYAFQPPLVAFTPLIIRDATFWFFFNAGLYCIYRAADEASLRWYTLTGFVLVAAVHLRTEGWFLFVPLVGWSAYRLTHVNRSRLRVVFGVLGASAVIPLAVTAVNLTVLRDCPRWEMVRPAHARVLLGFVGWRSPPKLVNPAAVGESSSAWDDVPLEPTRPATETTRKLATRVMKTFTYSYGLMGLLGAVLCWPVYRRSEHVTLLVAAVLLISAIRMLYARQEIDIRYMLPIVIMALPWMALGVLRSAEFLAGLWKGDGERVRLQVMCTAVVMAMVIAIGLRDTKLAAAHTMVQQASLGRWIFDRLGPNSSILGTLHDGRLVAHYAQGLVIDLRPYRQCACEPLFPFIDRSHPHVILLWRDSDRPDAWDRYRPLTDRPEALGYVDIPQEHLPAECTDVRVLLRVDRVAALRPSGIRTAAEPTSSRR
ncbi:MAG: glycosyltransferase family 39 protein [Planctomycetota bacterium]